MLEDEGAAGVEDDEGTAVEDSMGVMDGAAGGSVKII